MADADKNTGFHSVAMVIYKLCGGVAAFCVVLLCLMTMMDISLFTISEMSENIALALNPNLFNKDSIDFETLLYSKNKTETEPYTIFQQQNLVIWMMYIGGFYVVVMFLDVVIMLLLWGYSTYYDTKNSPQLGMKSPDFFKPTMSMVILASCILIYSAYYTAGFSKSIQPELIESSKNIQNITKHIYDNLSTDEAFLKSIVDEKIEVSYKIINKQGSRSDKIGSMLFTLSLYDYYKTNTVRSMDTIKEIFNTHQIRVRSIIPVEYMYYNQSVFIPNIYPKVEPFIKEILNDNSKKDAVRNNTAERLNHLNRLLTGLFRMNSIRSDMRFYLLMCFLIALSFAIAIGFIYKDERLNMIIEAKKALLNSKI